MPEPIRATLLSDSEEPQLAKWRTDKADPTRAKLRKLIELPK
jgi:hypothetical protein